jgi:ribose-phosphate pyrophosphokinase
MGAFLARRGRPALLLGPDAESEQWVRVVAEGAALNFAVANKVRKGDNQVAIELPRCDYRNREVVLVDDVASTGRTLIEAARAVQAAGAARVDALVTHALFADDAFDNLLAAGITQVWSSDSIAHPSNAFSLAKELAARIRQE